MTKYIDARCYFEAIELNNDNSKIVLLDLKDFEKVGFTKKQIRPIDIYLYAGLATYYVKRDPVNINLLAKFVNRSPATVRVHIRKFKEIGLITPTNHVVDVSRLPKTEEAKDNE